MYNQTSLSTERPLAIFASNLSADGFYLARQFATDGFDIIVAAKNPSVVEEAEDLKSLGIEAVSFQIDLSTMEGIEQLYRRIVSTGRAPQAIVICAGLSKDFSLEKDLAQKVFKFMADYYGRGRILFAGCHNQKVSKPIYEDLQQQARGSGVVIAALGGDESEEFWR